MINNKAVAADLFRRTFLCATCIFVAFWEILEKGKLARYTQIFPKLVNGIFPPI